MPNELSAAGYRDLARECLRAAKKAEFKEVREAYEKLAYEWLNVATEIERRDGSGVN